MLAHDEVWVAIDDLAERNGLSASGLARRAGLDPTTFNKSKRFAPDGRPRWPSTESISKILRATNTTVGDLFGFLSTDLNGDKPLSVPLVGTAHAGFEGAQADLASAELLPQPPRIITFPDRRHEPLYALSVIGDSMLPLYRNGDVLFVSDNVEPSVGDRVVVKLADSEIAVKVLKRAGPGLYEFHAVNPEHSDVTVDADDVEYIARIVYASQ